MMPNMESLARIGALESENRELKAKLLQAANVSTSFTTTNFAGNDELIMLYTGFPSFSVIFEFLEPAMHKLLKYWGEKDYER